MRRYGWKRGLPDFRDFPLSLPHGKALPARIDLSGSCPPVYDQGDLGSCTANAIGAAHQFEQMKQREAAFMPSRLFVYYNERALEGTVSQDAGAIIRDGMKVVAKQGVCPEAEWPYNVARFKVKPSAKCYTDGAKHLALQYLAVKQTLADMQGCLAAGFPFVFGFSVYESFESDAVAKTGIVPMPKRGEQQLGGHAVLAVGYDCPTQRFIVRNSWGAGWGKQGYFTIPFSYLVNQNLASDFWTLRLVE